MVLSYLTLFSVELLHLYCNKTVLVDCSILPSEETKQYFNGSNLLFRFVDNRLYALITEFEKKPFVPLEANRIFRFYIKCNNPSFFNYTNIEAGSSALYYFSNLANNGGAELNLSQPIADYAVDKDYLVGDFARESGTENTLENIRKGRAFPLNDPSAWIPRGTQQFVTGDDLIRSLSGSYRYLFASPTTVKEATITIRGFHITGATLTEYDALVIERWFPVPVAEIQADLSTLPFGKYKIVIKATTSTDSLFTDEELIYYDLTAKKLSALGVIEIFNHLPYTDTYSLLNDHGDIKETAYVIRFANRNALWKYITQTTNVSNIISGVPGLNFIKDGNVFTSDKPIEFKQFPDDSFMLEFSGSGPPNPVKASYPSPALLKCEKEMDGTIKNYFSEIHLNY